jgi:rubrerythrin
MKLHTASESISFAKELENESAKFYEGLAERYPEDQDVFLSFAQENGKYVKEIERAYYGVITDAIEGCFAFDIETEEYTLETSLAQNASYPSALDKAIEIEGKIMNFYSNAAEQSKSLMADVPRAFKMVVRKRGSRSSKLKSLLLKKD